MVEDIFSHTRSGVGLISRRRGNEIFDVAEGVGVATYYVINSAKINRAGQRLRANPIPATRKTENPALAGFFVPANFSLDVRFTLDSGR